MMPRRRLIVPVAGSLLVVIAASTLVWSAVTTSSARLSASTSGSGFFSAGVVDLAQPESAVGLLFDADGLHPGESLWSCVVIGYEGSIPAAVRLHAVTTGGTGLERYVELRLWARVAPTSTCPEGDPGPVVAQADRGSLVFDGLLADLWRSHPNYGSGLELISSAESDDRMVLVAEARLVDDQRAQGRSTEFNVVVEARP